MRVFGCAWKINFPEVIWSWPCKMRLWPWKWFEMKIFTSNHFWVRRAKREREREREREHAREEEEGAQIMPSTLPTNPELQSNDRTHQIALVSSITTPRRSHHASRSCHSISPSTQSLQPTDLSLWFWFLLLLWWCGSGVLVVVAFDCRSLLPWVELEFRLCVVWGFGYDFEIFCNKICLDAEKIAEKMWKICRKIAFSE